VFEPLTNGASPVQIGALIETLDGAQVLPGSNGRLVLIRFWADEAAVYATPGATFRLWYGGYVGDGVVDHLVKEVGE
jgi:hypothetical protein